MPKVTVVESHLPGQKPSKSEILRLKDWTGPIHELSPRRTLAFNPDTRTDERVELPPRAAMKPIAQNVYLLLRESSSETPRKLARYDTATKLGISPEAFNSQLVWLEQNSFITLIHEGTIDVIQVQEVPPSPTGYVKRDFRGKNDILNKFKGICVTRLGAIDGPSFSAHLGNWQWWMPLDRTVDDAAGAVVARLAPFVPCEATKEKFARLYWRLFMEAGSLEQMVALDEGLLLKSLYGPQYATPHPPATEYLVLKAGMFPSARALNRALTTLQAAKLIYQHHPAMTIAVFPPNSAHALADQPDWAMACGRAIDSWLLDYGLANHVATFVDEYRKKLKFYGLPWSYETGLWKAARDLHFSQPRIAEYEVEELLEWFLECWVCGDACDHQPHRTVREQVPLTLSGFRDHLFLVYEQVLRDRGLIRFDGAILDRASREPLNSQWLGSVIPTTVETLHDAAADWAEFVNRREKQGHEGRDSTARRTGKR